MDTRPEFDDMSLDDIRLIILLSWVWPLRLVRFIPLDFFLYRDK